MRRRADRGSSGHRGWPKPFMRNAQGVAARSKPWDGEGAPVDRTCRAGIVVLACVGRVGSNQRAGQWYAGLFEHRATEHRLRRQQHFELSVLARRQIKNFVVGQEPLCAHFEVRQWRSRIAELELALFVGSGVGRSRRPTIAAKRSRDRCRPGSTARGRAPATRPRRTRRSSSAPQPPGGRRRASGARPYHQKFVFLVSTIWTGRLASARSHLTEC